METISPEKVPYNIKRATNIAKAVNIVRGIYGSDYHTREEFTKLLVDSGCKLVSTVFHTLLSMGLVLKKNRVVGEPLYGFTYPDSPIHYESLLPNIDEFANGKEQKRQEKLKKNISVPVPQKTNSQEEKAIIFLLQLGYKILAPKTVYEEVLLSTLQHKQA